ncbi:MAG: hypothetical protein HGA45_25560 [Chloroflexales bacterium]|nr:hypothetical protein [Chloroflexales bacterium]
MAQDDQQPERAPGGRISRDTLLLLGALTFLILAVALTFLFTPNSGTDETLNDTVIAEASATPEGGQPYPAPTLASTAVAGTEPYPEPARPSAGAYPVGGEGTPIGSTVPGKVPTGDISLEASPSPSMPAGGLLPSTDVSPSPQAGSPYPAGPVGEGTPPPLPTLNPTVAVIVPAPTVPPPTTPPVVVQPTAPPAPEAPTPTEDLSLDATATAEAAEPTMTQGPPPPPPADMLRGNVRWSAGQSPIILRRDVQIAPGAELIVEPGVEIRLDPGVSIYIDGGRLLAMGLPGQPVRFVGATGARWSGLFGRPNSFIVLENTEVSGGGAGGTVLAVEDSELIVRASRFNDNGGAILLTDTKLELRDSDVSGNDVPFGPALEASYARGSFITLSGNRFGGNRLGDGTPQVRVSNSSTYETLNLDIQGNLMRGGVPNLQLATNGPLKGSLLCNSLVGDGQGFSLRTQTPQVKPNGLPPMELYVENNFIDEHLPPIIPVYLRYGLGRGATSEILLDLRNNWWGEASGPYEPDTNPLGRGDSVGNNIIYSPWLSAPPACAPAR